MFSWVILAFRGIIDVILPTLIATSTLLMSLSLRIPPSPLLHVLLFQMSYLFLLPYGLTITKFPFFTYGCHDSTTSGYTRCPCPPTGPLADSSSMPPSSLAPIPQLPDDLPIAIRKGTRSTFNPHPVYNFLSFHRLSLPYFAFVFTLSYVSTPKSTSEALSNPGWK